MSTSVKSIRVTCQGAATLPIEQLVEFQGNLKKLSKKNLEKLKARILEDGFNVPFFVWDHDGVYSLLDGHQRTRALASLRADGYVIPALPVAYIEASDIADARKKLLAISSQYGEFDSEELAGWLSEMDEGIADTLRIVDGEMDIVINELEDPEQTEGDDELPEEVEPLTKIGDLWEFGKHRLLCGDSTDIANIDKLMDGKKADMVFTDPPYGVNYSGGIQFTSTGVKKEQREKLKNDLTEQIYADSIPIMASITNGPIYTWFAGTKAGTLYNSISKVGDIHALLIWVKNGGYGAMNANYKQKHEPCLYWKPKNGRLNFIGKSTETTIWDIDKDGKNKYHPTQKPVKLALKAISNHNANLIADIFLGSGSTLIACEKLRRVCYGMELDPHYCDVIVGRYIKWAKENGRDTVVKRNGIEITAEEFFHETIQ